jgi:hypothetical protein
MTTRPLPVSVLVASLLLATTPAIAQQAAQVQMNCYPLDSLDRLRLHNVIVQPAELEGKKGLKATISTEAVRRSGRTQEYAQGLVRIDDLDFSNGVIEAELAGALAPGAGAEARGFVGIAFRMQEDLKTYDAFYLRPLNGRAEDQERRNHSAQYISLPEWPWSRLRKETPSKYESYVDLVPGAWTKIKIEVRGEQARFYVHDNEQPTLIVNDVKSGPNGHGGVALWLEPGTVAHFRNLTIKPSLAEATPKASESVRNGVGMQLRAAEQNTQPPTQVVSPGSPLLSAAHSRSRSR